MYQLVEWKSYRKKPKGAWVVGQMGVVKKLESKELEEVVYVEEDYRIRLKGRRQKCPDKVADNIMVASIGEVIACRQEEGDYDLTAHRFREPRKFKRYIRVTSQNNFIRATDYLRCLVDLTCEAIKEQKQLVVYVEMEKLDECYEYRSLWDKAINLFIRQVPVLIIHRTDKDSQAYYRECKKRFEPYEEKRIYTSEDLEIALDNIRKNLCKVNRGEMPRQNSLYEDIFYWQIPDDQEIYVPVAITSTISPSEYEELGFEYITLASGYGIIRGTKSEFNAAIDTLYDNVSPQFRPQILLPAPLMKEKFETTPNSNFVTTEPFKGEQTYIGIIGVDGIDYTNPLLLDKDNQTRIAYVWEQTVGNTGNTYTSKDIQQAIDNQQNLSILPSDDAYLSTTLLGIAGGSQGVNSQYAGVASEAKFVVVKINKAPDQVQEIYVGKANPNGVLLEDILIGLNQMIAFANKNKEPIVICLPYGSNISSHDGEKFLESRINNLARQPGVSIITMTGEEANKKHHGSLEINSGTESQLNIVVAQENQKIVGAMWINPVYELYVSLYNPSKDKSYDLTKRATYIDKKGEIVSNGEWIRFDNGFKQIFFSMENLEVGEWTLVVKEKIETQDIYEDKVDIWLTQETLNKFITVSPADVFTTITSLGNIQNLICVGNYNERGLNAEQSSGRGFTRDNFIKPTLITTGKNIPATLGKGQWGQVNGSVVAMAKIAGAAAVIYSKLIDEGKRWFPNTLVMASIMLSNLERIEGIDYPNESQGNGIFNQESLNKVLKILKNINF